MHLQIKNADKIIIKEANDIYAIMQMILKREHIIDRTKEHFWVIALNVAQKIANIELVGMGTIKRVLVSPVEVFSVPIQKKASSIVLVHNHPSGSLKPSEQDKDITNRLIQVGLITDTPVLDHVIITEHSFYSFADNGLIEELRWNNKYALTFIREKQIKAEVERIKKDTEKEKKKIVRESISQGLQKGRKEGIQEGKMEIARQMLASSIDPAMIKKITGVTDEWLEKTKRDKITKN